MNFVEIAGHLGADPEERFTSGGKRVVSLRVATKSRGKDKEDITIWWRVNIWNDRFDKMLPYLKKGSAVIIYGELSKPETYVDKEGKTQVSLTITAEVIRFSPFGKGKTEGQEGFNGGYSKPQNPYQQSEPEMAFAGANFEKDSMDTGDDLPF